MVKRILGLTIIIGVITSCSVWNIIFHSRSPENYNDIFIGTSECALPCLYGIIVGQTNYLEALDIIAALPQEQIINNTGSFRIAGTSQNEIFVTVKRVLPSIDNHTSSIELLTYDRSPIISIDQLINSGWTPTRVFRNPISGPDTINLLVVFGDDSQIVAIVTATESVNESSPITSLFLVAPQDHDWLIEDIRTIQNYDDELNWLGYTSVNDYLLALPIREVH